MLAEGRKQADRGGAAAPLTVATSLGSPALLPAAHLLSPLRCPWSQLVDSVAIFWTQKALGTLSSTVLSVLQSSNGWWRYFCLSFYRNYY